MLEGMLPVGSVLLLKNSKKKVMVIGVLQKQVKEGLEVIWDYSAVLYPEGYMGPDKTFLFNADMIDKVFALGYQDDEQFVFKTKIDQLKEKMDAEKNGSAQE